jgi:hypothetical protein
MWERATSPVPPSRVRRPAPRTSLKSAAHASPLLLKYSCMLLPFVRELFTDVEKLPAFARVASHLKEGTGRIRVSGLTSTSKAQRAAQRPII